MSNNSKEEIDEEKINQTFSNAEDLINKVESLQEFSNLLENLRDPRSQIRDPLSDVTRRQRKGLLLASLLSYVIVKLGIKPDRITAIGFEFDIEHINSLSTVLALVVGYFLVTFISYAASDFIDWQLNRKEADKELKANIDLKAKSDEETNLIDEEYRINDNPVEQGKLEKSAKPVSYFRVFIEFVVPIACALVTLYLIIFKYA